MSEAEKVEWSIHSDPSNFDITGANVLDVGAEVLALREEDGKLVVTTARGTFPLDPRFFDG